MEAPVCWYKNLDGIPKFSFSPRNESCWHFWLYKHQLSLFLFYLSIYLF